MPIPWRRSVSSARSWIVTNWPIKIAALLLSAVLWAATAAQEPTVDVIPVTLNVRPPEGRAFAQPLPQIEALYAGAGRELFKLRGQPPLIRRSIPDTVTAASYTFELSTSDLQIVTDADVTARDIQPRLVTVYLDEVAQQTVPVVPQVIVRPDSGYQVVGKIAVVPDSLTIRGPKAPVQRLNSVFTVPLTLDGVNGPVRQRIGIDTTALGAILLSQDYVEVAVSVEPVARRTLTGVPVQVGNDRSASWEIDPPTVSITLSGPAARLALLTLDSVSVVAPVSDRGPADTVRLDVVAPSGLTATAVPDTVVVRRSGSG